MPASNEIDKEEEMKVICEHYQICSEPCLHRNVHDSSELEKTSCRTTRLFCNVKGIELHCIPVKDCKEFPALNSPLFKEE